MENAIQKIPNAFAAVIAFHIIVVIVAKSTKWAWDVASMGVGRAGGMYEGVLISPKPDLLPDIVGRNR